MLKKPLVHPPSPARAETRTFPEGHSKSSLLRNVAGPCPDAETVCGLAREGARPSALGVERAQESALLTILTR